MAARTPGSSVEDYRTLALRCEGASEGAHMERPDFRANGRIFGSLHPDRGTAMVKLTPGQQETWLADHPAALAPASGAWGRQGYTLVELAQIDRTRLGELVTTAWQNVMAMPPGRSRPASSAPRAKKAQKK
ncbi:MAG: MmcQ/YjbR family DNA-binding protein [bacterium]|nr:MmcQ/YjbR family DNA-binding protein [bacterium]